MAPTLALIRLSVFRSDTGDDKGSRTRSHSSRGQIQEETPTYAGAFFHSLPNLDLRIEFFRFGLQLVQCRQVRFRRGHDDVGIRTDAIHDTS